MKRLTVSPWEDGGQKYIALSACKESCQNGGIGDCTCAINTEVWKRLAAYEDAEQEGRLVVLPCKAGDTLYQPMKDYVHEFTAPDISWLLEHQEEFGKTVFLTRVAAEVALIKRKVE